MKTKHIILTVATFFTLVTAFSQSLTSSHTGKKMGNVILQFDTVEPDSALATHPILYPDISEPGLAKAKVENELGKAKVLFFPEPKKGIVRVKFQNLPKGVTPELEICNSRGNVIKRIWATKAVSTVNLRTVPKGTYILIADIDEERFSWEIEKE